MELDFTLSDFVPTGFFQGDVWVEGRRHLLFATSEQLKILKGSKRWFIDATFKEVKAPVTQLLSIHVFLKSGDDMKQVPAIYVFMSGKRKVDYSAVFAAVKNLLPENEAEQVVLDFEAAMWGGIREVLPEKSIKGCVFHWTQAVFRHVQSLGLQQAYHRDHGTRTFVCKLMALAFVPEEYILRLFLHLSSTAQDEQLSALASYVYDTWVDSSLWPPSAVLYFAWIFHIFIIKTSLLSRSYFISDAHRMYKSVLYSRVVYLK